MSKWFLFFCLILFIGVTYSLSVSLPVGTEVLYKSDNELIVRLPDNGRVIAYREPVCGSYCQWLHNTKHTRVGNGIVEIIK